MRRRWEVIGVCALPAWRVAKERLLPIILVHLPRLLFPY